MLHPEEQIKYLAENLGAGQIGFADISDFKLPQYPSLKSAVSIGIPLLNIIADEISSGPTYTYFHHYRTINSLLDTIALRVGLLIQSFGHNALPIPASQTTERDKYAGLFSHKAAATRAGLGWIGKSALFISPVFGPRIRLVTVLTDLELRSENPIDSGNCKGCTICTDSCPSGAIHGKEWVKGTARDELYDAETCSKYMKNFNHIGRGVVCGICINVCPYGKQKK